MKCAGRMIQFFTFVEDGRGPPRGKPEEFLFSEPLYLLRNSKHPSQTPPLLVVRMLSPFTHY